MSGFLKEYNILAQNAVLILTALFAFTAVCGIIRFSIAVKRRKSGVYPPAASQMEDWKIE
jgi:hypothetical protein